ncbi:MAG: GNAT family N-acetyltransferase [Steroidobacteraceae bacterium]|jgi:GNAT superfamily N-acetyltransferase
MRGGPLPAALTEARRPDDFADARVLFREYAAELGVDLCFQGFEAELDRLPDLYCAPAGCLLIARADERPVGCGALRRLSDEVCEMKRLYVRAEARGTGLGRILAECLIATGRALGYARMRLDTLARLAAARQLYRSLGFAEIAPYYDNPLADVVFMELELLR